MTAGVGSQNVNQQNFNFSGVNGFMGNPESWPGWMATSPLCRNVNVFNFGISGQTIAQAVTKYNQSGLTTTGNTAGTTTVILTGTTTIPTGTLAIASSFNDIPYGTTATVVTGTATLSAAATGTHSGETIYFTTANTYGVSGSSIPSQNFVSNPHLVSPTVTGVPGWYWIEYGNNDDWVNGVTATGTLTNGSAVVSGLSVTGSLSVGGATVAGCNGYNMFVSGNGVPTGTFTSTSSTTGTLSAVYTGTTGAAIVKFLPQPTWLTSTYQTLVNDALADGYQVTVTTLWGVLQPPPSYNEGQYDEGRQYANSIIRATYGNHAYSANVYVADIDAGIPEFQLTNANTAQYRNALVLPHMNSPGYHLVDNFLENQFVQDFPSSVTYPYNELSLHNIPKPHLPFYTLFSDQNNTLPNNETLILVSQASTPAGVPVLAVENLATTNAFVGRFYAPNTSASSTCFSDLAGVSSVTNGFTPDVSQDTLRATFNYAGHHSSSNTAKIGIAGAASGFVTFSQTGVTATGTFTVSGDSTSFGNAIIDTVGKGLQVKEGSNAKQGTFTLTSGTVTVANTSVTSTSRIYLTGGALNSSTAIGELDVTSQTAGTGFTITSYVPGGTTTQTGDLRTVAYEIFEPAP